MKVGRMASGMAIRRAGLAGAKRSAKRLAEVLGAGGKGDDAAALALDWALVRGFGAAASAIGAVTAIWGTAAAAGLATALGVEVVRAVLEAIVVFGAGLAAGLGAALALGLAAGLAGDFLAGALAAGLAAGLCAGFAAALAGALTPALGLPFGAAAADLPTGFFAGAAFLAVGLLKGLSCWLLYTFLRCARWADARLF